MQFRVDGDEHVLFPGDFDVADLDLGADPLLERLTACAVCDVAKKLLWYLRYLLHTGHVQPKLVPLADVGKDGFYIKSLETRNRQKFHFLC